MNNEVGIAVIGCGYWGVNYVRIFNELPGVSVAVICDQRRTRLEEVGQRFPGAYLTTELEEALQHEDVDAVVICTSAATHHTVAQRAIAYGKHLLIEKPLTITPTDAKDLIDLAAAQKVKLMVGHTFLYNPGIQLIKDQLAQESIGEIYYLYSCRTNLGPIRQDVNALWDLAPHDISIFNYLLESTPLWVSAVGVRVLKNCREDVGFISLGYPNDVVGHIHVSWADPNKVRELVIVGSNKRIVFNDLNLQERVKIFEKGITPVKSEAANFGEFQFMLRDGDIISPHVEAGEPLKNQCQHFIECIVKDQQPRTSGFAGLDVVRVMTAIDQSLKNNGAPIALSIDVDNQPGINQEVHYAF